VQGMTLGTGFPNNITFDNVNIDANFVNAPQNYGLQWTMTNSKLRSLNSMVVMDGVQNATIKNSIIENGTTTGMFSPNNNASGTVNIINCTVTPSTSAALNIASGSANNRMGQTSQFNIYQLNGNVFDNRRFNYFHYSVSDLTVRKRGITTLRIKPSRANTPFYLYNTLNGIGSVPQRIKGSLQFNSNYGTSNPPSISFVGAGVNTVFACASTANVWQDFDLTLNPTSTDDILMTITCQSSGTNGFVWLDGLPFNPFIQDVRHYGFVFDNAPSRVVNNHNTLTENQVSSLSIVSNLDYLYDVSTYWSVTNPASSYYVDIVTVEGSVLDFDGHNFIIDSNASSVLDYDSITNTVTIKSSTLTSGSNFDTLLTTGSTSFLNDPNVDSSVKIRSLNYDSEIIYTNVDNLILYPTQSDAQNSTNPGLSSTNGIIRFKYGTTSLNIPMSGTVYAKWSYGGYSDTIATILQQGTNALGDISRDAGYSILNTNMNVINDGIQKTSILSPHTTSVVSLTGLSSQIQILIDKQQIINNGLKNASLLIPHTTSL
jgi:hypothetical protein